MAYGDRCILLMSCIVDIYLLGQFFNCFFEKRISICDRIWKKYICNVLAASAVYVVNVFGNGDTNLLLVSIIMWLYVLLIFVGKTGSKIICYVMAISIIVGCECIYALMLGLGNKDYRNMADTPLVLISLKLLTYVIFIIVEQIVGKTGKKMNNQIFIKYLIIPISGFGMMLVIFYLISDISINHRMQFLMTICYALMLVGNIVVFYEFNKYSEEMHNNMEKQILLTRKEADLDYYKQMIYAQEERTELIHNMNHYMGILYELAKERDDRGIIRIVDEIGNKIENVETSIYSNSSILNAILSEKKKQAVAAGVKFDAYIEPEVKFDIVEDSDLIAMLGNLLDNALRAATDCKTDRYVKVRIFMQNVEGFYVVKIVNGFSGKVIKTGEDFITTKKEKGIHGIGIRSVNKMAEKYGGYLTCNINDNCFEAILLLATE